MSKASAIRVLVVARDVDIRRRIAHALAVTSSAFDVEEVPDQKAAGERLSEGAIDVAVVRLQAPDGLAAVRSIHATAHDVPIVALLATGGPEASEAALNAGAVDSMTEEPLDGEILRRTIRYAIERSRLQVRAQRATVVDAGTGLYNARGFEQLTAHHLLLAERSTGSVVVVFVRIDLSTSGRAEGTPALVRDTAEVLREAVRHADVVGRLGADTFGVLLSGDASGNEGLVLTRIVEAVATRNARGGSDRLSMAIGSATSDEGHRLSASELIRAADARMRTTPERTLP
jgi:two-component system cell cycle response regulator